MASDTTCQPTRRQRTVRAPSPLLRACTLTGVSACRCARTAFYVRIKNRAKKSAYALGDNEVLVPKRHFRARQVAEDRDKWTALFQLVRLWCLLTL